MEPVDFLLIVLSGQAIVANSAHIQPKIVPLCPQGPYPYIISDNLSLPQNQYVICTRNNFPLLFTCEVDQVFDFHTLSCVPSITPHISHPRFPEHTKPYIPAAPPQPQVPQEAQIPILRPEPQEEHAQVPILKPSIVPILKPVPSYGDVSKPDDFIVQRPYPVDDFIVQRPYPVDDFIVQRPYPLDDFIVPRPYPTVYYPRDSAYYPPQGTLPDDDHPAHWLFPPPLSPYPGNEFPMRGWPVGKIPSTRIFHPQEILESKPKPAHGDVGEHTRPIVIPKSPVH